VGVNVLSKRPVLRSFLRSRSGVAGLIVAAVIVAVAIVAPPLLDDAATRQDFGQVYVPPSWEHPLGTDALGRDTLARLLVATRLSVGLGLASTALALVVGVAIGGFVAVLGPRLRPFGQRCIDTLLSFPSLLVAIFVGVIIGIGGWSSVLGVGLAMSFSLARVTNTLALSIAGRDYVQAARVVGVGRHRVLGRYVIPNIAPPLIVAVSVAFGASLVAVSALSFLGLGVQPPEVDWGRMLTEGVRSIYVAPAGALAPAAAVAITAVAFGLVGDAVAKAMNPRLWTESTARTRRGGAAPEPAGPEPGPDAPAAPDPKGSPPAVAVRDLVVSFPTGNGAIEVVKGVSLSIAAGERVGIVGESGSGKTMTALAIAQLVPHPGRAGGTVELDGCDLSGLSATALDRLLAIDLAFVFQDPSTSLNPALRIGTQLTESPRMHRGLSRTKARGQAVMQLREVEIPAPEGQLGRYPHELSGGMRQRAMIAMGLMNQPTILIADEPTTALDVTIQAQIMEVLNRLNAERGTALILISHDLPLISQNCDRILVMYAGRVVEELHGDQLLTTPEHPYTRALLAAAPEFGAASGGRLQPIPGEAPDLAAPPPGCSFHPRCPLALDRCRAERPPLVRRPGGRKVACWAVTPGRGDAGAA
jgi:peptide/nickel transport system permease protein